MPQGETTMDRNIMDKNKKIVFTQHSRERFGECGFKDFGQAVTSFRSSTDDSEMSKFKDMRKMKKEKYGDNGDVKYRRNGTIIFTYSENTDRFTHGPIYVIITITNQLVTSGVKI
jgi:hypothetical protein